jgi:hypothetical protein
MHMQFAERCVPIQHTQRGRVVEMAFELFGSAILNRVATRFAWKKAWAREFG